MFIGREVARWQNWMTVDDWYEDLAVQKLQIRLCSLTLVLGF